MTLPAGPTASRIGRLNDIVCALAKATPDKVANDADARDAFDTLDEAMTKIDKIKQHCVSDACDTAHVALAGLGQSDKAGYGRLVRTLDPDKPPGTP